MVINMIKILMQLFLPLTTRAIARRDQCPYTSLGVRNVAMNLSSLSFHPIKRLSNVQNVAPPILSACCPCFPRAAERVMRELRQPRLADRLLEVSLEPKFMPAVG